MAETSELTLNQPWTVRSSDVWRLSWPRLLMGGMLLLQVVWLCIRWLSHQDPNWQRIPIVVCATVLFGILCIVASNWVGRRCSQFVERWVNSDGRVIAICWLGGLALGVFYASTQVPFTDEAFFLEAAEVLRTQGLAAFFSNYHQLPVIARLHPPLIPVIHGVLAIPFGLDLFTLRLVSVSLAATTVLITYLIGRELYDKKIGLMAALLLLSFRYFVHLAGVANNDMAVTFCFTLAMYLVVKLRMHRVRTNTLTPGLALGATIGLGLLSKYTMLMIYPIAGAVIVWTRRKCAWPMRTFLIAFAVSIGMLAAWLVYANQFELAPNHVWHVGDFATGTASSSYGQMLRVRTATISLPSAIGVYHLPLLFVAGFVLIRRKSHSDIVLLCWIGIVLLTVFSTVPVNRYFLPMFPALALMVAAWIRQFDKFAYPLIALVLLNCGLSQSLFLDLPAISDAGQLNTDSVSRTATPDSMPQSR